MCMCIPGTQSFGCCAISYSSHAGSCPSWSGHLTQWQDHISLSSPDPSPVAPISFILIHSVMDVDIPHVSWCSLFHSLSGSLHLIKKEKSLFADPRCCRWQSFRFLKWWIILNRMYSLHDLATPSCVCVVFIYWLLWTAFNTTNKREIMLCVYWSPYFSIIPASITFLK